MLTDSEKGFVYANRVLVKLIEAGASPYIYIEMFHDSSCRLVMPKNTPAKIMKLATELLYSVRMDLSPVEDQEINITSELKLDSCGGLRVGAKKEKDL